MLYRRPNKGGKMMLREAVKVRSALLALGALIAVGGCAHAPELKPQSPSQAVAGKQNTAAADVEGVHVLVAGDAWKGHESLADQLTPIKIALENRSGRPLRLSYPDFTLNGGTGAQYSPLAATKDKGAAYRFGSVMKSAVYQPAAIYVPVTSRCTNQERLADAPYPAYSYPGVTPAGGVFPYAAPDEHDPSCPPLEASAEMLAEALPQGVVQNNARVSGFIYFQGVGNRESTVQLQMNLVDANNGQSFGRVAIPFAVSK
jgi:hypothetical protein